MSEVSSSVLYHYTSKMALLGILRNGFRPSYCKERIITSAEASYDLAVPMTCFCDMPEKLAAIHRVNYGEYAIGLSDRWRVKNRLNPILYVSENSDMLDQIIKLGDIIVQMQYTDEDTTLKPYAGNTLVAAGLFLDSENLSKLKKLFFSILIRIKPYVGPQYDKTGKLEKSDYKYYDEREYRYIFERLPVYGLDKKSIDIPDNIKKETESEPPLSFNLSDIGRIIVKEPSEVKDVENLIKSLDIIGGRHKPPGVMPNITVWHDIN